MAENKTKPTGVSVQAFLDAVPDSRRREDSWRLVELMSEVTGEPPAMWGPTMVGFGSYHYRYASGHEGDMFLAGFAPRKDSLVLYVVRSVDEFPDLVQKLGKFRTGKSCLYVKSLNDIDLGTLRELVRASVARLRSGGDGPSAG